MVINSQFLQGNTNVSASSVSTLGAAFSSNIKTGDLIVVQVVWGAITGTVSSVTDSVGNTYKSAVAVLNNGTSSQQVWYCQGCTGSSSAPTVTVTLSAAQTNVGIAIAEYSGLWAIDASASGQAATGTAASSGNLNTLNASDIIISAAHCDVTTISAVGGSQTTRVSTNTTVPMNLSDQVVTALGTYSGAATLALTDPWIVQSIAFKATPTVSFAPYVVTSPEPYVVLVGDGTTIAIDATNRGKVIPPIV